MEEIKFYISQIEGSKRFVDKEIKIKLKPNLLLSFENLAYLQFEDTIQYNWEIRRLDHISDLDSILKDFENINNIALVHHGAVFSPVGTIDSEKIKLKDKMLSEYIPNVYNALSDEDKMLDIESQSNLMFERSFFLYKEGIEKKYFLGFLYLKKMISSISDGGNFFSIACDEADTDDTLEALGKYTDKNICIFANTKYTTIGFSLTYSYSKKIISRIGSILNIPLTDNWTDNLGWRYFDVKSKKIITTGKDLILKGTGTKPFKLIKRSSLEREGEYINVILYYSKKFKNWYIENWKKESYENWKNKIKKEYNLYLNND